MRQCGKGTFVERNESQLVDAEVLGKPIVVPYIHHFRMSLFTHKESHHLVDWQSGSCQDPYLDVYRDIATHLHLQRVETRFLDRERDLHTIVAGGVARDRKAHARRVMAQDRGVSQRHFFELQHRVDAPLAVVVEREHDGDMAVETAGFRRASRVSQLEHVQLDARAGLHAKVGEDRVRVPARELGRAAEGHALHRLRRIAERGVVCALVVEPVLERRLDRMHGNGDNHQQQQWQEQENEGG